MPLEFLVELLNLEFRVKPLLTRYRVRAVKKASLAIIINPTPDTMPFR